MTPPNSVEGPEVAGYRAQLPGVPFTGYERQEFYSEARRPDVAVVIATGDDRIYANLLLTIGVRTPTALDDAAETTGPGA
jgi:L-fucose mutarotase